MSSSLLNNRYIDKLDVNRLQVNQLKANEVLPEIDYKTKSYLFSAILNNVQFKKIENINYNAELIINLTNQTQEVIQFTDRQFTQSNKITIQQFVQLFLLREPDSFKEIPPNVVLIFNNTQKSYTMSLANFFAKENNVVFNLKLLTGEEHTQDNFTGTINMFVDNVTQFTITPTVVLDFNTTTTFSDFIRGNGSHIIGYNDANDANVAFTILDKIDDIYYILLSVTGGFTNLISSKQFTTTTTTMDNNTIYFQNNSNYINENYIKLIPYCAATHNYYFILDSTNNKYILSDSYTNGYNYYTFKNPILVKIVIQAA